MNLGRDFWEKCAILQCLKNEALGEKDTGSYYDDEQRLFLMELSERDLIRCVPMPGHKIRIIGFGDKGRKIYLDANGDVLPHYKFPIKDLGGEK